MSNMLNSRSDRIMGGKRRVHDGSKVFDLEVDLIQGLEQAPYH